MNPPRNVGDFIKVLRGLHKGHVCARLQRIVHATNRLIQPEACATVGSGDDQKVGRLPGACRCADLVHERCAIDDGLVFKVAALLGKGLVLDMHTRHAPTFVFAHGARHVEFVAKAGIGIGKHRNTDRISDPACVACHLGHGGEAIVGITECGGSSRAGHVDRIESRLLNHAGGDAVVGARCNQHLRTREEFS